MVWWWALGLPSALTRCVIRGGPHTLSEPYQTGRVPVPIAAGLPFGYKVAGTRPVGPAPPQSGASWPDLQRPLLALMAAERMGALGPQTRPRAQPGASPGWRGVGAGSPPGAQGR